MISRVADHCFWFGRYLDRAESTARLLQATRTLAFDADVPVTQCWHPLVIVSGQNPSFVERHGSAAAGDAEVVQRYMVWDGDNMVSLRASVRAARESARAIRDVLSLEVWEEINELYLWLGGDEGQRVFDDDRERFYRHVRRGTQLCLGLVRSTMLHDSPMSFLWLGTMLERVGQIARILDMHPHTMTREAALQGPDQIVEVAVWLSLLRACSGFEAFMKKRQGRVTERSVVSFMIYETQFPRSLRYCLRSALGLVGTIWPDAASRDPTAGRASRRHLVALSTWLDEQEASLSPVSLHELLTHVVDETGVIASAVEREILGPVRPTPVVADRVTQ